jgi:predicted GIY-YIG superfamily endonuclease
MQTLYRLYDLEDQLLYVGISSKWHERFHQHEKLQPWWDSVTKITLERFDSREQVVEAERVAIKVEKPSENKQHSQTYESMQDHFDMLKFYIHFNVPVDPMHADLVKRGRELYGFEYFQIRGKKTIDAAGILRSAFAQVADELACRNCVAVAGWGNLNRWADLAMSKWQDSEGYEKVNF